jgi:hypothetical protein
LEAASAFARAASVPPLRPDALERPWALVAAACDALEVVAAAPVEPGWL